MDNNDYAIVRPLAAAPSRGTVEIAGRRYNCALGRSGVRRDKREGDGATPAGQYPIRRLLYRADRLDVPPIACETSRIEPDDGWCDDPASPRYNLPIRHPFPGSAERLWREDHLYDVVAVLGHNDAPPIPGLGSAIFMHVATPDYGPTAGCVALRLGDLLDLLAEPTLRGLDIREV